jgi:hypothetical protein
VHLPHHDASPEASDHSGGVGSTGVPPWLERDWEDYTSRRVGETVLVEDREP